MSKGTRGLIRLDHEIPGSHIPGRQPQWRIPELGKYLSHHCRATTVLEPLLLSSDSSSTSSSSLSVTCAGEQSTVISRSKRKMSVQDAVVDDYMGVGAIWTVFSASLDPGKLTCSLPLLSLLHFVCWNSRPCREIAGRS